MGPCRVEGEKGPCGNLPTAAHPSLSKQKQKGVPATEHPSCTTIYAAATGLPLDTAPAPGRAPRPPPQPAGRAICPTGLPIPLAGKGGCPPPGPHPGWESPWDNP